MNYPGKISSRTAIGFVLWACLALFHFTGCRSVTLKQKENLSAFIKDTVSYAERFTIEKAGEITRVTIINPWQGSENISEVYYLIKRGQQIPSGIDSSKVIFIPVEKIICMSTTHIAMVLALGQGNTICGVSGADYIFSDLLTKNIEKGLIEDVGYEGSLNNELILKIIPDLVMMYGIGSESVSYIAKIKEMGVNVVFNADYLETDPLGKAEWIKLIGVLYCKEELADSIFNSEVRAYNDIKKFVERKITHKPTVLLGLPYKDTWYVSPGNSFISKLISDAGGEYIWQNTRSSISMPYGLENVYIGALSADYWLNIGTARTKEEILNVDRRLGDLKCFKDGNLYNNVNRITVKGGNDFWESGTQYPHLILKDIAVILHPELFDNSSLFFYKKIN